MGVAAFDLTEGRVAATAVTDTAGRYAIAGLAAGPHLIIFADPTAAHTAEIHPGTGTPTVVSLTAGTTATIDADLGPATAPPATATIGGSIAAAGTPLAGGWVAVVDANTGRFAGGTTTGPAGTYTLGVPAGNYFVEIIDPTGGHAAEWHADQPITGLAHAIPVTATAGTAATVDADLAPTGPTGWLSGTVTSEGTGSPVPGAWVASVGAADGRFAGGTVAGLDGTYTLGGLAAGTYVVVIIDPTGEHIYEYHHDAASFFDATPLAIAPGHTTALDAALAPT